MARQTFTPRSVVVTESATLFCASSIPFAVRCCALLRLSAAGSLVQPPFHSFRSGPVWAKRNSPSTCGPTVGMSCCQQSIRAPCWLCVLQFFNSFLPDTPAQNADLSCPKAVNMPKIHTPSPSENPFHTRASRVDSYACLSVSTGILPERHSR
ncbi:unnamed protein product [Protopolystoma xenopodis]|uniref:Uncharacterized protein n=1 Tax=Protopolystoma xenopodis TaxID=117903 RepID=A0A3S5BH25_9PLAT|nr:unnamed protein product [Protopolystoma xenopodis]